MEDNSFNKEKAMKGEPVCTRDGKRVRIVCWNVRNDNFPILALVMDKDGREHPYAYTDNGRVVTGGLRLESDLVMYDKNETKKKMYDKMLMIKFIFKDCVGADFLEGVRGKCHDTITANILGDRELLISVPYKKPPELYSYINALAAECSKGLIHDFKCVYMDKEETFGECGYYETFRGVLLGSRFVNKVRQTKTISEFFSKDDIRLCVGC